MGSTMQLEDWLDDLCVRFIINLPQEDLSTVARICFQVEEAQWFYEDFIRPLDASLPAMSLRQFCLRIFQHCPLLSSFSEDRQMAAFDEFLKYKERIPVRGAIMLNEAMDQAVLVKGWKKGASWSFPRGKINKDEHDLDCAIRELWEETGYDVRSGGLILDDDHLGEPLDVTMREQHLRFYVFRGVPMDTHFEPKTRKEISKIQWYPLSELPGYKQKRGKQHHGVIATVNVNKFYMVAKFLPMLERWIKQEKVREKQRRSGAPLTSQNIYEDVLTEEEGGMDRDNPYASESAADIDQEGGGVDLQVNVRKTEAALKALLRIQPQLEQAHEEARASQTSASAHGKGDALMAFLRPSNTQQPPPQTPIESICSEVPPPETPHHHPPRPFQLFSSTIPPPSFPIQHHVPQQHRPLMYTQGLNERNVHEQQQPTPAQYLQLQHNSRGPDVSAQYQNMAYSTQTLKHPQPLPPQVQRAVFSGGVVHGPAIPQTLNQISQQPGQQGSHANRHQQAPPFHQQFSVAPLQAEFSSIHAPTVAQNGHHEPSKLNSHSLALLNAFKTKDNVTTNGHDEILLRFQNRIEPSELPADRAQPTQDFPELSTSNAHGTLGRNRPPVTKEHRNNLLGMFKSPISAPAKPIQSGHQPSTTSMLDMLKSSTVSHAHPLAPPAAKPVNQTLLNLFKPSESGPQVSGNNVGPVPVELPAAVLPGGDTSSPRQHTPKASALSRGSNRTPNMTIPFRPAAILQRPTQAPYTSENVSSPSSRRPSQYYATESPLSAVDTSRPFPPQILKRSSHVSPSSQPQTPQQSSHFSSPNPVTFPNPSQQSSPLTEKPTGRQFALQNSGQKQALLSLFNKPSSRPYKLQDTSVVHAEASRPNFAQQSSPASWSAEGGGLVNRSRVGSLASMAGSNGARRGSSPSSKAVDNKFLLGFLDQVAKGNGN